METDGNVMEYYDRLKLSKPLSGNVPETVFISDNLILWTKMTGINQIQSLKPLAGSWFHDFTGKFLRSGHFLSYSFDLGSPGQSHSIGSDRNSSGSLVSDSDRISDHSDIRQLPVGIRYQGFRRIPIGSDKIRSFFR